MVRATVNEAANPCSAFARSRSSKSARAATIWPSMSAGPTDRFWPRRSAIVTVFCSASRRPTSTRSGTPRVSRAVLRPGPFVGRVEVDPYAERAETVDEVVGVRGDPVRPGPRDDRDDHDLVGGEGRREHHALRVPVDATTAPTSRSDSPNVVWCTCCVDPSVASNWIPYGTLKFSR